MVCRASITTQRARLAPRDLEKALAQPLVEFERHVLEAGLRAAPRARPRQSFLRRQVQHEGERRLERAGDEKMELAQPVARHAATEALIGFGRIGEAVAQHDAARRERGPDGRDEMAAPRRHHEQRLALAVPALGRAGEKEAPDLLGARRPARLARRQHILAAVPQRLREKRDLRRLAGALAALEGDEAAARQRLPHKR